MLKRKFPRLYWRIGDVSRLTGLPQQTLRYWEQEFPQLRPRRDPSGVRVYRERELRLVVFLQHMVEREGHPIAEVREFLSRADMDALLDGVDLETVVGQNERAEMPKHSEQRTDEEVPQDALRDPLEEVDEPNPWDDEALAEAEPPLVEGPAPELPQHQETPSTDEREPLPAWVADELRALRAELVAMLHMLEDFTTSAEEAEQSEE